MSSGRGKSLSLLENCESLFEFLILWVNEMFDLSLLNRPNAEPWSFADEQDPNDSAPFGSGIFGSGAQPIDGRPDEPVVCSLAIPEDKNIGAMQVWGMHKNGRWVHCSLLECNPSLYQQVKNQQDQNSGLLKAKLEHGESPRSIPRNVVSSKPAVTSDASPAAVTSPAVTPNADGNNDFTKANQNLNTAKTL